MIVRPKVRPKLSKIDKLGEVLTLFVLIATISIISFSYKNLQDFIPNHFNIKGIADSFGPKKTIWLFPILSLFFYIGLSILIKYPYMYNYPVKITEKNALNIYRKGVRVIIVARFIIVLLMFFLSLKAI